jgi:hypothetical protein
MQSVIDKTSPLPLYVQVADWLESMILKGKGIRLVLNCPPRVSWLRNFSLIETLFARLFHYSYKKDLSRSRKGWVLLLKGRLPRYQFTNLAEW